jgi:hypothetical protein
MSSFPPPAPKKRGCLFYGCISLIVLGLLIAAVFVAGYFVAKRLADRAINDYTDSQPAPIEAVTYASAERAELQRRLDDFKKALDAGKADQDLVLSAADLNALITENPQLKGKLFVIIDDDQLQGKVSIPLEDIGPFKLKGRYLNGVGTFHAVLTNSVLDVRLDDIVVKSNALPAVLVGELKKQNLAKDYQATPEQKANLSKFESIVVKDGKVHLRSRGKP